MKHRTILAVLAVLLCIGLCGCSAPPIKDPTQLPAPTEETHITSTTLAPMEDSITYVDIDSLWVPVSFICDGEQLLTGDVGPYSMVSDSLLKDAPPVENLSQTAPPEGGVGLGSLASDGAWDLYPDRVDHRIYFPSDPRPQQSDWESYFRKKLDELHYDGPVVICESVSFSWEGRDAAFVTASNVVGQAWEDNQTAQQPGNSNPSIYVLSALFVQGNAPMEVYSKFFEITYEQDATEGVTYVPYEDEDIYLPCLVAMQYGTSGDVEEFPVFCNMNGELLVRDFIYRPGWRVADTDGDGISEVIVGVTVSSSMMNYCEVYELEQGMVKKELHISLN